MLLNSALEQWVAVKLDEAKEVGEGPGDGDGDEDEVHCKILNISVGGI